MTSYSWYVRHHPLGLRGEGRLCAKRISLQVSEDVVDGSIVNILGYINSYDTHIILLHSIKANTTLCTVDWYIHPASTDKNKTNFLSATIGWFIPFSIVLLFPIDLASTTADNICRSDPDSCSRPVFYLNDRTLLLCWRIGYWTTFALTWYSSEAK